MVGGAAAGAIAARSEANPPIDNDLAAIVAMLAALTDEQRRRIRELVIPIFT